VPTAKWIRQALLGVGVVLLTGSGVRLYRLVRTHTGDYFFAPHFLLTFLSLLISWSIIKVALRHDDMTRKTAISLIRSGSILLALWGYRLYLLAMGSTLQNGGQESASFSSVLAVVNIVMGTVVMVIGLKVSRAIVALAKGNSGS
jgi:hypothetical protein